MLRVSKPVLFVLCQSALMAAATLALAAAASEPATASAPASAPLKGKILSLNYGGRGEVQGFMLGGTDKPVQINIPNEMTDALKALHTGDVVEVTTHTADAGREGPGGPAGRGPGPADGRGPQDAVPDHDVFDAATIKDAQGHTYSRPDAGDPAARTHVKVDSTLQAFNYDHRGVPDGIQLANGDVVHLGGVAAKLGLTPNQAISVEGDAETLPSGGRIIHATTLNGQTITNAPPGDPRGAPPASPMPDRKLQDLP